MPDDPRDPADPTRVPRPLRSAIRAEREQVIARLQDAVAADHLELDELEERLDLAMKARSSADLKVLVADLPDAPPSAVTTRVVESYALVATPVQAPTALPAPHPTAVAVLEPEPIAMTTIFSGHTLRGRRVMPREVKVRAIFGGADLDLREATFLPGTTTVRCSAIFGGVNITVPPHVRIECLGAGIFGGFDADDRESDDTVDEADMPVLRIVGKAIFGGVSAERKQSRQARLPSRRTRDE